MENLSCPSCGAELIVENGALTLTNQTAEIVATEQAKLDATAKEGQVLEETAPAEEAVTEPVAETVIEASPEPTPGVLESALTGN
jgi:hypothetical protein